MKEILIIEEEKITPLLINKLARDGYETDFQTLKDDNVLIAWRDLQCPTPI